MVFCIILEFNSCCCEYLKMIALKNILQIFALLHLSNSEVVWDLKSRHMVFGANNLGGIVENGYYVEVLIGTPPQRLNILIDTGSSNFAVASKSNPLVTKYFDASTSYTVQKTSLNNVDVQYTEGFWRGRLVSDVVSIPSANFSFGLRVQLVQIESFKNFFINNSGWQGILGMAYDDIIRPQNSNLQSFSSIVLGNSRMDDIFSLKLCMADVKHFNNRVSGRFILGGYNRSLDPTYWTPVVKEWYYDVCVLGLEVGGSSVSVACSEFNNDKSIIDSGTTNLRLPTAIFKQVVDKVVDYVNVKDPLLKVTTKFWDGTDDLCWQLSQSPFVVFPNITIYLPSEEFNHTISLHVYPEHYILYRGNTTRNGIVLACYKFGISPSDSGTVLGAVLMEQYNVVFDRANKRIGFATSDCSPTSVLHYTVGYINTTDCSYITSKKLTTLQIVAYVFIGLMSLCLIPVCILGCVWCYNRRKRPSVYSANLLHASALDE